MIMVTKAVSVAKDYSETPAGRYRKDGPYSGQRFREELLVPALTKHELVEVNLDDTLGYGSSFLEEAFGGLIREHNMDLSDLRKRLHIVSARKLYANRAWKYLEDAQNVVTGG